MDTQLIRKKPNGETFRIGILHPDGSARERLVDALTRAGSFECVGEWPRPREALKSLFDSRPDLMLIPVDPHSRSLVQCLAATNNGSETREPELTNREWQIASLIALGYSNQRIASELELTYSTVKNYVSSILEKLNLDHRTQIAIYLLTKQEHDAIKANGNST